MPDAEVQRQVGERSVGDSTAKASDDDGKKEPEDLLALAEQLYEKGKLGECLVVLEAAKAGGSPGEQVGRQRLVVQMHIAAKNKEWWKVRFSHLVALPFCAPSAQSSKEGHRKSAFVWQVLQLKQGSEEKEVRASYKKLAQQVHFSCQAPLSSFVMYGGVGENS